MFSLLKAIFFFWVLSFKLTYGRIFTFKMHNLFSEPIKNWPNSTGKLSLNLKKALLSTMPFLLTGTASSAAANSLISMQPILFLKDFELSIYDPKGSSTSKKVTCNSSLCAHRNQCPGTFSNCPDIVSYMSAQTSTSGVLLEDVLHLTTEDDHPELVEAHVTFGFR